MPEKQCSGCDHFVEIFGGREGGGERCPHDTTPDRKTVHARDYACSNYTVPVQSQVAPIIEEGEP